MPKDEWGVKRLCPSCSTRFYDLQRDPMTCPSCGASFDLDSLLSKKTGSRPEKKDESSASSATSSDDDAVVLDDDDSDDLDDIADVPAEDDEN